jgi:Dolichyl-phosphate-mannose-protein mannosyltransferase
MRTIIIGVACVAIGIAADALFLPHQSLWNDETAQMSGLSLDPVEVTRWLAGKSTHDFGLARDRMPPLSYWTQWTWSKMTGLSEKSLRWLGVVCVSVATAIVFAAANRAWGLTAGVAASLLLATSPNVVSMSVEIRAYPILLMESAGIYACLVGYATSTAEPRRRWLAGIVVLGIAAMYTHFFGLVALGGALVAAFVLARVNGESVVPVLAAGAVTALVAVGLTPFILASSGISRSEPLPVDEKRLVGLVRLVYRLFSHPAMSISRVTVGLAALGFGLGIVCGLAPKDRSRWAATSLAMALASGGAVVMLVHLAQSKFEAARPSYNIWMLPPLAILIASGLAARARAVQCMAIAAILLSLATNLYADGQLAFRGDVFAHCPHRQIAALIRVLGPQDIAVIHDSDSTQSWDIYAPIQYDFGGEVRQYVGLPDRDGAGSTRVTEYPENRSGQTDLVGLPFKYLIVVRSAPRSAQQITSQVHHGITPIGDGPVTRALLASGGWERVEEETFLAFVGADVDVFRKVERR